MPLEALLRGVLVLLGDVVVEPAGQELTKQAARILRPLVDGMPCQGEERQPLSFRGADEVFLLGLVVENQEPACVQEILEGNVLQGSRLRGCRWLRWFRAMLLASR